LFSELRSEVIVRFVAIGGIVDHLCLNFIFIINMSIHDAWAITLKII